MADTSANPGPPAPARFYRPSLVGTLTLWGFYLLWRLLKFTRIMAAIRYAIPTKGILWINFGETLPEYGWYEEVWLRPWAHPGAMLLPQRRAV